MTLEVLFARAAQGRVFLLMTAGGVLLGALAQLSGWLRRWRPLAGAAGDLFCAASLLALLLYAAFAAGTGLRLYALLGLCIGLAIYFSGVGRMASWALSGLQKRFARKAGKPG